jgi:hypothetical protein
MSTTVVCFCGHYIILEWGTHYHCQRCGRIGCALPIRQNDERPEER